jgi:hypothetical protein
MPNLTYLIPFATMADREKAWEAFSADPEWVTRPGSTARMRSLRVHLAGALFR